MKKYISFALVVVFIVSGCTGLLKPEYAKIAVSSLLDEIQVAVDQIKEETSKESLPPFHKAEITLSTVATKDSKGKASFYLSAEGAYQNSRSDSIVIVLVPNEEKKKGHKPISGSRIAEYVIATVEAIDSKKDLHLKKLTVTADLKVTEKVGGGVSVDLVGLEVEGTRTSLSSTGHKLRLFFGSDD